MLTGNATDGAHSARPAAAPSFLLRRYLLFFLGGTVDLQIYLLASTAALQCGSIAGAVSFEFVPMTMSAQLPKFDFPPFSRRLRATTV